MVQAPSWRLRQGADSSHSNLLNPISARQALYLGEGDLSDHSYHDLQRRVDLNEQYQNLELQYATERACVHYYRISPSSTFEDTFRSNLPRVFAFVVATIFFVMAITFFVYDTFVSRRNTKVMRAAIRSTAIVSSLFPSQVRDRLYEGDAANAAGSSSAKLRRFVDKAGTSRSTEMENDDPVVLESKPIADLFPDTTVMFCDIAGFTAWSSVREPSQVFTLLETVYRCVL